MKLITTIEGEEWKIVPGFPQYEASTMGRFRRGPAELKGKIDRVGYQQIGFMDHTKTQRWFLAHRMIAATFFSPEALIAQNGTFLTVNHKNRVKTDNRLVNLELVTVTDNHRHWRKTKLSNMACGDQGGYTPLASA